MLSLEQHKYETSENLEKETETRSSVFIWRVLQTLAVLLLKLSYCQINEKPGFI